MTNEYLSICFGLGRCADRITSPDPFKACPKEPGVIEGVAGVEDFTMRKAIAELDDEHRAVLLEIADFGTAAFSSGLIVAILKSIVDLFV